MERLDLRLNRVLTAGGLALVLVLTASATGCRSARTRSEVPPAKGYSPETGQPPPVTFSSQPNVNAFNGLPSAVGTGAPGTAKFGTPAPGSSSLGYTPTPNPGPPGTSGMSTSPTPGAAGGAGGLPLGGGSLGASGMPEPAMPKTGISPLGPGPISDPAAAPASAPAGGQPPAPNPFSP